jgi:hypothetical protein
MLPQRREQKRSIILNPEVAALLHKVAQALAAFSYVERAVQVCGVVPLLVPATYRAVNDCSLIVHAQEEVDRGLLVSIC